MATELLSPLAGTGGTATRGSLAIAWSLRGRYDEAIAQERALAAHLLRTKADIEARFSLLRLSGLYTAVGRLIFANGLLHLRGQIVAALGRDPDGDAALVLHRSMVELARGDFKAAGEWLTRAEALHPPPGAPWYEGNVALQRSEFQLLVSRSLTLGQLDKLDRQLTSAQHRMRLAGLRLGLRLSREELEPALVAAENQERLARNAGIELTPVMVAYTNAKLDRHATADAAHDDVLARLPRLHEAARPHHDVAATLLELDRPSEAVRHAREAYRQAWADGPGYRFRLRLRDATDLLARLGEEPPRLPERPREPEAIPLSAEVEAFIERLRTR